ncbi:MULTISPECIES: hypothetical protein [Nitrosomonas]|uniref:hypothetical protein n=1 Tax=Nitrosomonas TaxID=914 RepID=UPI000943C0E8|nr:MULTISPECIES: hypothetical protein [Nitrosomonas]MXS79807.1 hypothetical protein [Nitrosomonas sp. GH22]
MIYIKAALFSAICAQIELKTRFFRLLLLNKKPSGQIIHTSPMVIPFATGVTQQRLPIKPVPMRVAAMWLMEDACEVP